MFLGITSQVNAQLFTAPDTVCINQDVYITNNNTLADASYYWGFCSGYLANVPEGSNLGMGLGFSNPSDIELAKQDGNYYGFVVNKASNELMRLDFGTNLTAMPTVTNFGTMLNTIPEQATSLFLVQDSSKWFLFVTGGSNPGNSSLARIDFGNSLTNTPNSVNFGNLDGDLNGPCGIFVAREDDQYYGFVANNSAGSLARLTFGANISNTPEATDLGNIGALLGPSDMAAVQDEGGDWHLFITDLTANSLVQANLGASLTNTPVALSPFTFGGATLFGPSSVRVVQDCGKAHAFITNQTSNELVRVDLPSYGGGYTATNLGDLGAGFSNPNSLSPVIRIGDELRGFVLNSDNSISAILYSQCSSATIPSSATVEPPVYTYTEPGFYNIYLVVNEGQPNAQVQCHQIRVLPKPNFLASNDTLICQGDTVRLGVQHNTLLGATWMPTENTIDTGKNIGVFPSYTTTYTATLLFPGGCLVDTNITVTVSKVQADAGPDRVLADGAHTVLGGPLTSMGPGYTYFWTPAIEMDNVFLPNPTATPKKDLTYYLQVTNTMGCQAIDTVIVKVVCNDINLPNAFAPESKKPGANKFGMLNTQVVKLNYLRVYDRWGKLVFETSDPMKAWDGKVDGQLAQMGVYVWEADGFCLSGQRIKTSGNVTLLR